MQDLSLSQGLQETDRTDNILTMSQPLDKKLTYADAGVDIEHGNELVKRLKKIGRNTNRPGTMGNIGGFGALFDLGSLAYRHPVLVSGTDGVGTKIKLALENNLHATIGIDLVAMCVNDLIVQGAEPLYFLDYFACSELDADVAEQVINGIARGCKTAGCSLVGGETAEMPGMYRPGDYDLAGFCVGAVEKDEIIDGENVCEGDVLIALASNGCHANGYSLIRKIITDTHQDLTALVDGKSLLDQLMQPTRIYVKPVLELIKTVPVKAIAHITGGGLIENIPRVLPDHLAAPLDTDSWEMPGIFQWLRKTGNIDFHEMYKTFNCGVGLVICVADEDKNTVLKQLETSGEQAWKIGEIEKRSNPETNNIILK